MVFKIRWNFDTRKPPFVKARVVITYFLLFFYLEGSIQQFLYRINNESTIINCI